MTTFSVPTYLSIDLKFEIASIGVRVGAFAIDWFIKWLLLLSLSFTVLDFNAYPVISYLIISPFFFYSFIFEWLNKGQSIGKLLLKCRVMGIDGNYPSIYQCATRWIFLSVDVWFLSIFTYFNPMLGALAIFGPVVGLLMIAFTKNQQRFGDIAAHTIVVKTKQAEVYIEDTVYAYAVNHKNYEPKYPQIMRLSDSDITKIKVLFERGDAYQNYDLSHRLSTHLKQILNIESNDAPDVFLKQLLNDYNFYSINEV